MHAAKFDILHRILVCSTCNRMSGVATAEDDVAAIQSKLEQAGLDGAFSVATTECLGACASPVCAAVQGKDRASYIFSDLAPGDLSQDIDAFCELYLEADRGWIEDARPAGRWRFHLRARIPTLS